MLPKMYIIPADRLHGSPLMKRKHLEQVNIFNHQGQVKIRKHHPYEEWIKMRQKMNKADITKKTETNAFADFFKTSDAYRAS